MAQDDGQERTEEATPKRQREAREKGQIARSRELNTLLMLLASAAGLMFLGEDIIAGIEASIDTALTPTRQQIFDTNYPVKLFQSTVADMLLTLSPFFSISVLVALLAPSLLGGWSFSLKAIGFKWNKLDPIKGMGRVFGWQGVMELVKAIAKFTLVLIAAIVVLWFFLDEFLGLGSEPVKKGMVHAAELIIWAFLTASLGLSIVAVVDVPFQIWNHNKQLKMTRQEIKDEFKDTEGKPEIKRRVREVQMEMSRRRMMAEVPKADVIITNPTHFAIALRYDQAKMAAPVVVAKGADLIAAEIRRVATEANVPLLSSPALARSIYYTTELNEEIPAGLYKAAAMVLAYVFQIRKGRRNYRSRRLSMPNVPIPDELKRE